MRGVYWHPNLPVIADTALRATARATAILKEPFVMSDSAVNSPLNAQVAARLRLYKLVLGFNMTLHIVIGLTCLFFPYWVAEFFNLP